MLPPRACADYSSNAPPCAPNKRNGAEIGPPPGQAQRRVPAPTQRGGLFPMTRTKTPILPTYELCPIRYPQAAQRSEKRRK